jgi:hypothetical protein
MGPSDFACRGSAYPSSANLPLVPVMSSCQQRNVRVALDMLVDDVRDGPVARRVRSAPFPNVHWTPMPRRTRSLGWSVTDLGEKAGVVWRTVQRAELRRRAGDACPTLRSGRARRRALLYPPAMAGPAFA